MKALILGIAGALTLAIAAFVSIIVIVSIVGPVSALAAGQSSGMSAKVGTARTGLGRIVVDARGRTLYLFEKDRRGRSACSGACAVAWPPLLTHGTPVAVNGARRALLGVIRRSDGTRQVTYAGHPVYRYLGDTKRGQTNGEGSQEFGAGWDALSPAGKKIERGGD